LVLLRDPGSYIDANYPGGLLLADPTQRFFRGSGSSQAAAVTSGAAALLLQYRPRLKPDQVKRLLMRNWVDKLPQECGGGQASDTRPAR
jgi:serine protease AprX